MAMNGHKPGHVDKTYQDETIEYLPAGHYEAQKNTAFGQRAGGYFKRFWWILLILLVGAALVITLVLVFAAFPHIAQSQLDDAKFELLEEQAWNPTPDQVYLRMVTLTTSNSHYHPRLDAFNASLFLEDTEPNIIPFGYIEVPATQVLSQTHTTIDQVFPITNMDQFIAYNKMVFKSDTYRVAVRGRLTLREGSLPTTTVNFNKVVVSKGLNSLQGFKVANFSVSLSAASDGSNVNGTVYIPNQSPLTLTLGTVVQDIYVDGQYIGNSTIDNMVLAPGDNYLPMRGVSDQSTVLNLINSKYKNGILPITVVGNSVVYNGQHITYYEQALKTTNLTASLDVGTALKAIGLGSALPGGSSSSTSSASLTSATRKP